MKQAIRRVHDADMVKVGAALKRAAARARQVAVQTNTPLVIYKDGRVTRIRVAHAKVKSSTRHK